MEETREVSALPCPRVTRPTRVGVGVGVCLMMVVGLNGIAAAQPSITELKRLSLEDLMSVEVMSVSKKDQKIGAAASAIFVISQEDIRRSGVTSVPEVLRLVPGLSVARIGRGFVVSAAAPAVGLCHLLLPPGGGSGPALGDTGAEAFLSTLARGRCRPGPETEAFLTTLARGRCRPGSETVATVTAPPRGQRRLGATEACWVRQRWRAGCHPGL